MSRTIAWLLLFAVPACKPGESPDGGSGGDADTDADADADTDADADSDADSDTDTTAPMGQLTRVGAATVGADYHGTEELKLVGDNGYGDVVCDITYDMDSIAVRSDCALCTWAFDVQSSNATVVTDVDGACLGAAGVDAATVGQLDGVVKGYGYDPLYFGHAEVLMTDETGSWDVGSYCHYDDGTQALTYEWQDGFRAY